MSGPVAEPVLPVTDAAAVWTVASGASHALIDNVPGMAAADVRESIAIRTTDSLVCTMAIIAGITGSYVRCSETKCSFVAWPFVATLTVRLRACRDRICRIGAIGMTTGSDTTGPWCSAGQSLVIRAGKREQMATGALNDAIYMEGFCDKDIIISSTGIAHV